MADGTHRPDTVAALQSALRQVTAVAVTVLYTMAPRDARGIFSAGELEEAVRITATLSDRRLEDIYRSAWDLANGD